MGRTTIHDIATFGNYQIGENEEGQPVFQASWKFKDSKDIKPEHLAAVAELSTGKDGLKIKLHDPNVTNGAIVIHTQRLKSDPGGNLLS